MSRFDEQVAADLVPALKDEFGRQVTLRGDPDREDLTVSAVSVGSVSGRQMEDETGGRSSEQTRRVCLAAADVANVELFSEIAIGDELYDIRYPPVSQTAAMVELEAVYRSKIEVTRTGFRTGR